MSGIYIHIPFCKKACHYCDFHFSTSLQKKTPLLESLKKELVLRKGEGENTLIETIYFGGGTPSVLEVSEIKDVLACIKNEYDLAPKPEITLEANPDDLSLQKIIHLKEAGINRLSIGIQSFFKEDLELMNRAHNAEEAKQCIIDAKKYFDNITVDLIYGMPNMTEQRWTENIKKAIDLDLPHISSYALTVEPNTALSSFIKKGKMAPLNEAMAAKHYQILCDIMEKNGYVGYEFSNFGKVGYFSKNNTGYWQGKKYIGIGPSAHSFNGKQRSWNINNNPQYIKSITENRIPATTETLSESDAYNEYVMTGLRTIWGVSLNKIKQEFGDEFVAYIIKESKNGRANGLLKIESEVLTVTTKGKFLTDGLASDLFFVNP